MFSLKNLARKGLSEQAISKHTADLMNVDVVPAG